jgi:hypothetical protein
MVISLKSRIRVDELDEFMMLVHALCLIMRLKACVPIYHERFSIFLDLEKKMCRSGFISRFLSKMAEFLKCHMPFCIENFFIYGDTGANQKDFDIFTRYLSRENMINFVKATKENINPLKDHIDLGFLEKRMGGEMDDLTEYWPPRCIEDATKTLDENSLVKFNIVPFTYNDAEYKSYDAQTDFPNSSRKLLKCKDLFKTKTLTF